MQLKPRSEGEIVGIGGDHTPKTYMIHLGLPSGDLVQDVEVYCSDIDDYDVLIGMDIIGLADFSLTNGDGKTIFAYRIPSEGNTDF